MLMRDKKINPVGMFLILALMLQLVRIMIIGIK